MSEAVGRSESRIRLYLREIERAGLIRTVRRQNGNQYFFPEAPVETTDPTAQSERSDQLKQPVRPVETTGGIEEAAEQARENTQQQQGIGVKRSIAAADLFTESEIKNAFTALTALGMTPALARRYADRDHLLAIRVTTYTAKRLRNQALKPIRNKVGFMRTILESPESCGFTRLPGGEWLAPGDEAGAPERKLSRNERLAHLWQQATTQQREEATRRAHRFRTADKPDFHAVRLTELEALIAEAALEPAIKNVLADIGKLDQERIES
jgi:hypothetical protein